MHLRSLLYLLVLFSARCQEPISWRCANRPKWNVILQTELVEANVCPRVTSSRFDGDEALLDSRRIWYPICIQTLDLFPYIGTWDRHILTSST